MLYIGVSSSRQNIRSVMAAMRYTTNAYGMTDTVLRSFLPPSIYYSPYSPAAIPPSIASIFPSRVFDESL